MKKIKEEITHLIDPRITEIIKNLRDQNFGNKEQRHMFTKYIVSLANSNDPRCRKTIKKLGDIFTEIGDEMLKEEAKSEIKKYEKRF